MVKKKVKLTESKLKNLIENCVKEVLHETILNKIGDKFSDVFQGYPTKEGNPQSIEDVFEGDGYKVIKTESSAKGTYYYVEKTSGALGEFYGVEPKDMVDELNIFLGKNDSAFYIGCKGRICKFLVK